MVGKLICVNYSLVTMLECFKEGRAGYQLFPRSDIQWTSPQKLTFKISSFIVVFSAYCEKFVALSKGTTKDISAER